MKTNQIMKVRLLDDELPIGHLDQFGSLVKLFQIGNRWRAQQGKPVFRPEQWLALKSTQEFIDEVSAKIGRPAVENKRGKGGGRWAHLYVLLDAAAYLSPKLKLEIYEKFVHQRILEWRDRSGDDYLDLNAVVALRAEEVFGKPAHTGHYVNLAKALRRRILSSDQTWNDADAEQLKERARIEEALATMLRCGLVRDWDHLLELAEKV